MAWTQKQKGQFEKFKGGFTSWMYSDCELALYLAQTQFLVALGLFNYIETLGAFYLGYFEKDANGKIIECRRGNCSQCVNGQRKTKSVDRFKKFFSYLGNEYKSLSDKHPEMYKELRCGLSHEFLPSNRPFIIYHSGMGTFTEEQIKQENPLINLYADNIINKLDGSTVNCGVVLLKQNEEEIWHVFVAKLAADFRRGAKKFIREIENDQSLHTNFFETADQINFENF